MSEFHFVYDVDSYVPSGKLRAVMEGADKTVTLIAGPGTPHEKTYVKSCGENGAVRFQLAPGYEELYLDRDCIQECSFVTTAR